ncbi:MAG: RHS repeat-associated core domain-containing protein [Acidimicrobiaceae bacterium]|nr:RHS repeat-associated core domain-containing protein [Acidimicrobiaceae bacterium]
MRHYGYDLETGMLDTIQAGWDTTPSDLTGNTWFQYDRYTRDPVGNVTVIEDRGLEPGGAGSNIKECFVYDEWNRLVRAHTAPGTTDGSETVGCATSTGTNITARGATSPYDRTWSFDDINRITGSADKANGNATTTWGYSTTKHAVLSLTGQTSGSYSYNTVGAMVTRNGDTLTYDPQQRLTGYDTSSVDDTYLYTTSNQRLIRQHGSTVTLYLGDMEIGYDGTNTTVTRYISIAGTQVATRTTLNGGTATIAWNCGNMQNSTICQTPAATTATPPIPGRKRYTPYGGDRNTTPYTNTDHGFLGQPEDTTGLTYLNNRYHDPTLAAFTTVDPLVGKTGTPYLYANGNPVTLSDPSGLAAACEPYCNRTDTNSMANYILESSCTNCSDLEKVKNFKAYLLDPYHDLVGQTIAKRSNASFEKGCGGLGGIPDLCRPGHQPMPIGEVKYDSAFGESSGADQLRRYIRLRPDSARVRRGEFGPGGSIAVTMPGVGSLSITYRESTSTDSLYLYQVTTWNTGTMLRMRDAVYAENARLGSERQLQNARNGLGDAAYQPSETLLGAGVGQPTMLSPAGAGSGWVAGQTVLSVQSVSPAAMNTTIVAPTRGQSTSNVIQFPQPVGNAPSGGCGSECKTAA